MMTVRQIRLKMLWYRITLNRGRVLKWRQVYDMMTHNNISVSRDDYDAIELDIVGQNNTIKIGKLSHCNAKIHISIFGDNNTVTIGDNLLVSIGLNITMGNNHPNFGPVQDIHLNIGNNCSFESTNIITYNCHNNITIGDNCMFAFGITVYNTDGHPILNRTRTKLLNKVGDLQIGNHCWIGAHATILKNTHIANDCIIGWGSVVSGNFEKNNCIIAGNPAVAKRSGITWDANGCRWGGYIKNE